MTDKTDIDMIEKQWGSRTFLSSPRMIIITIDNSSIVLTEEDDIDDGSYLTVASPLNNATVKLTATQLWKLSNEILEWFGCKAITRGTLNERHIDIRKKIVAVFDKNEARCLDDDIDRNVVIAELMMALT